MSHHRASSIPPATAGPSIAPITGLLSSNLDGPSGPLGGSEDPIGKSKSRNSLLRFPLSVCAYFKSQPAQNAPPSP